MLAVRGIHIAFDENPVLHGVDLEVEQGEILCLLGPSGCGKTTLLRVIAGLEFPQSGDVCFEGQSILAVPVHQRGFGLMFQDFALFPHLDVVGNIAFGLKMQNLSSAQRSARFREVLKLVGLSGFERRDVAKLSGGERQRVALARSLAPNPRLLMLDEPLGSLDAALRERLVVELRAIIKRIGLTAIYVTHDQNEAFAIADRIAVMNAGRIEQTDAPEALYRRPASTFVADFLRLENVFPVIHQEGNVAHTVVGDFPVDGLTSALLLHPDGITQVDSDRPDAITGIVQEKVFMGDAYRLKLQINQEHTLVFKVPSQSSAIPRMGEQVTVAISPSMVIPLTNSL